MLTAHGGLFIGSKRRSECNILQSIGWNMLRRRCIMTFWANIGIAVNSDGHETNMFNLAITLRFHMDGFLIILGTF